jgi:hypothetical protein
MAITSTITQDNVSEAIEPPKTAAYGGSSPI